MKKNLLIGIIHLIIQLIIFYIQMYACFNVFEYEVAVLVLLSWINFLLFYKIILKNE
jgi:hypothetical protein